MSERALVLQLAEKRAFLGLGAFSPHVSRIERVGPYWPGLQPRTPGAPEDSSDVLRKLFSRKKVSCVFSVPDKIIVVCRSLSSFLTQ